MRYKLTQTWGAADHDAGTEAAPPREFETLTDVSDYLRDQMRIDKQHEFDVVYKLFEKPEPQWIERKFVLDAIRIMD